MTYELWHLEGKSMIDWFEDRDEALEAVRAYLDADEADLVLLIVRDASGAIVMSPSGAALTEWAMADFERRLENRTQTYGMEQLLRYLGPESVVGLPKLISRDSRNLEKMAGLIADLGTDETKEQASVSLVDIAPSVTEINCVRSRDPVGNASSISVFITCCVRVFWTSTTGLAPVTTTVSSTAPTFNSAFTAAVKPADTSIASRRTVAKPGSVNVTAYVPGRSSVRLKRP